MAFLGKTFDATTVEPSAPRELLPPGDYLVQIVESEMKQTRDGNGSYLALTLDVMEGEHAGRKLLDNLNLINSNQQAVEIAQRTLSAICHATGKLQVSDSEVLHFIPMMVKVAVENDSRDKHLPPHEKRKQNAVKGYKAAGGSMPAARPAPAAQPRQSAPPPAAAEPASLVPPWRSKPPQTAA